MNTEETFVLTCSDSSATEAFAEKLASKCKGREVIELVGDVGAGKTTFVKGLARGIGSDDAVSSPTFTLKQVYKGKLTIHHFDFYRLNEAGLIVHELEEALDDEKGILVVEWAETVKDSLPTERLRIRFEVTGEEKRKLHISVPQSYDYLEIAK